MDDLSVGVSACPVHCGKMADRIQMPFGVIGRTGPGMRQVMGFGDQSTGRGTFGGEFGAHHCNQWGLYGICARHGSLSKFLWTDLLYFSSLFSNLALGYKCVLITSCLVLLCVHKMMMVNIGNDDD